jgi:hypothetical protein
MSRKSAEQMTAVVPIIPGEREPPPAELSAEAQATWRSITEALPHDWFLPEARPMLKELCRHVHYADFLADVISEALESQKPHSGEEGDGFADLLSLMRAHGYQTERIGNLATKLRLTNQSRWSSARAADQQRRRTGGPRPWDDWK